MSGNASLCAWRKYMRPFMRHVHSRRISLAKPMAMRRIAMCERAGTGMRMMCEEWQKPGHPTPTCKNDRAWKSFELFGPELN